MEKIDEGGLFDAVVKMDKASAYLKKTTDSGKTLQVQTVRAAKLEGLPLGDLYWLIQAALARQNGAKVQVTDFYDQGKSGSSSQSVKDLMAILGLQESADFIFEREEDVEPDMEFWRLFVDYVREHQAEKATWGVIQQVRKGIDEVLGNETYEVPEEMERFLREMSVWVKGIHGATVQVMNHEIHTMTWIRRLYADLQKKFVRVALPLKNEYRGLDRQTKGAKAGVDAHRRRIQDFAAKMALQPSDFDNPEEADFYTQLFRGLAKVLKNKPRAARVQGQRYSSLDDQVVADLCRLDPALVPFYCIERDIYPISDLPGQYETEESKIRFGTGLVLYQKRNPGLKLPELFRFLSPKMKLDFLAVGSYDSLGFRKLVEATPDPRERVDFWASVVSGSDRWGSAFIYCHPILERFLALDEFDPAWESLKSTYLSVLTKPLALNYDFTKCPLLARIFSECSKEDLLLILQAQKAIEARSISQEEYMPDEEYTPDEEARSDFATMARARNWLKMAMEEASGSFLDVEFFDELPDEFDRDGNGNGDEDPEDLGRDAEPTEPAPKQEPITGKGGKYPWKY